MSLLSEAFTLPLIDKEINTAAVEESNPLVGSYVRTKKSNTYNRGTEPLKPESSMLKTYENWNMN